MNKIDINLKNYELFFHLNINLNLNLSAIESKDQSVF